MTPKAEDDEWPEPTPWTRRQNALAFVGIVITAIGTHYLRAAVQTRPTAFHVTTFNIGANQYCHPAKFYYTSAVWICLK